MRNVYVLGESEIGILDQMAITQKCRLWEHTHEIDGRKFTIIGITDRYIAINCSGDGKALIRDNFQGISNVCYIVEMSCQSYDEYREFLN